VVRPAVQITRGGKSGLAPWESRVGAGVAVTTSTGRAWIHHDGGARALLGPSAGVQIGADDLRLQYGRIWVEAPAGPLARVHVGAAVKKLAW